MMIDETDVMVWLVDNHAKASAIARDLPDHHRLNLADMLVALAHDIIPSEREWQLLLRRHIRLD